MDRTYRVRIGVVIGLVIAICAVYTIRLFALQLVENEQNEYGSSSTTTYTQTVSAARGDILDRHGNVLIGNRACYNVILQNFVLYNSDDPNGYLLSLAEVCIKNDISYSESLPLTYEEPFEYRTDELSSSEQYMFKLYLLNREWDADMSAENLFNLLKSTYHISDDYTVEQQRLVMGLRYELDLVTWANADTYTVCEDISAENLALLKELAIPGMDVDTTTVRETQTSVAAQLLGHVGYMTEEEYEGTYEALGYSMDAMVGKDGFEAAFEEYLHGTDGVKVVTVTDDGTVVDEYWETEPQTGANVLTTIDSGLQAVAETALADRITTMATVGTSGGGGLDASAGAVVVMDVSNGEVLAAANFPTYDPREYAEKYDILVENESVPLANRALMYGFAPGSAFKMITAIAGLRFGLGDEYKVTDNGLFTKYTADGFTGKCWIYSSSTGSGGHGELDMRGALANSCNVYFYTVGDTVGINNIDAVAETFGFGSYTGSEVPESAGVLASPDEKAAMYDNELDQGWYVADTLMASIGQSITQATPLQLCRYVMALANKGTLYKATFLRRVVSSDFQSLVYQNNYEAEATGIISDYEWQVIHDGMRQCATEGTAAKYLQYYRYEVCCKTGTAQHGTGGSDNAAFVCWAPAEDPEIAIAVYVEHGDTGGYYAEVAKQIMNYYFTREDQVQEIISEYTIVSD